VFVFIAVQKGVQVLRFQLPDDLLDAMVIVAVVRLPALLRLSLVLLEKGTHL
jgi:hypothetical protein